MRPNPTKRLEIPDAGKPGLYLVIQPTGKKSWAVRYRLRGRPRKVTLEGFPSLATAHKLAQAELDKVAEGRDPASEKRASKQAEIRKAANIDDLFSNVARLFIERYAKPKNRSWKETARLLGLKPEPETGKLLTVKNGIVERWGKRRVQDIGKRDVLDLLDGIVDRGAGILANRTLAALRKMFNWAVERDILAASPCKAVAAPAPIVSRDRILSDEEVKLFWHACDQIGFPFGPLGKLLLLTGQRLREVGGMTECELDPDQHQWTIPRERAKNDEKHVVPLSKAAEEVIAGLRRIHGAKRYVFTTTGETSVSGYSRAKEQIDRLMKAEGEGGIAPWTFHDLRRTVASGMARLGIALPTIEKILNHRSGSFAGIVGVYQRHDFADEKRRALEGWAGFLLKLIEEQRPAIKFVTLRAPQQ